MKKTIIYLIIILLFIVLIYLFFSDTHKKNDLKLLVFSKKTVKIPKNFKSIIKKYNKEKIVHNEKLNVFFPEKKLARRFKYGGISYQGLIVSEKTKIIYNNLKGNYEFLDFSVLNLNNSKLIYKIYFENKKNKERKQIFKEYISSESFIPKRIGLKGVDLGKYNLVFETSGKGVGGWINPLLVKHNKKPKIIVLIVLDTLRADHTSVYGYKRDTTPYLKKLAKDGVVYENCYSTTSWTLPAHTSLFSGKNLIEHGVATPNNKIPKNLPLITELLQYSGYQTFAFTGGGFVEDNYGFAKGFQYYSNIPGNVFSMNSAERVFIHFKSRMKKSWGTNIFVFLHTYQLHAPYKAPHQYFNHFNKKLDKNLIGIKNYLKDNSEYYKKIPEQDRQNLIDIYDSGIYYADKELIGKTIKLLKNKKYYKDSMIIVLSDHGEEFYDHKSWEHGHSLYRELIKIPLIIKYPENKKIGVEKRLSSIKDVAGIIANEIGEGKEIFKNNISQKDRELKILLPLSPIIKQFSPKISFVNSKYHFIFNISGEDKNFFIPPPESPVYELFSIKDTKEERNLAKNQSKELRKFIKEAKKLQKILKGLKKGRNKISPELMKKLKSLGYLK